MHCLCAPCFNLRRSPRPLPFPSDALSLCCTSHHQVFNISGERYVTFDGIARACAKAAGAPEPELVHFNAKDFDFGKKKVSRQEGNGLGSLWLTAHTHSLTTCRGGGVGGGAI